jgi:hypothetical protein
MSFLPSPFQPSKCLPFSKTSLTIIPIFPISPNLSLSNYPHLMVQDGNGAAQGVLRQRGGILDSLHRHFQGERHPPPVPAAPQLDRGEAAQVFPLEPILVDVGGELLGECCS